MNNNPFIAVGLAVVLVAPAFTQAAPSLMPFNVAVIGGVAVIPVPLTAKPGDPKEGGKVVAERRLGNCLSCHEIDALRREEFHGDIGPSLDGVARRWDTGTLRMIVVNAKKVFGDETVMPAFYRVDGLNRVRPEFLGKPILTAQQVEDVVAFLATLK
jgi:sulfur-oxidizing protein SoxX